MSPVTFGSLFAGIGGLDLGLERAGMVCKWQVEIDDYAQRVLAKHWPTVRRWDDVRTWPQPDTDPVDCICGGFPCQDISLAGNGAGLNGDRSVLFFELLRVVRELGPKIVVLENVSALLVRGMGDVLGSLAAIGFNAKWFCIPAFAIGAPHARDRVFIVAYPKRYGNYFDVGIRRIQDTRTHENGLSHLRNQEIGGETWQQFKLDSGRVAPEKWSPTGRSTDSRPLLLRNDDGISYRLDRLRGLGNAVVPQIGQIIGEAIMTHMTHWMEGDWPETDENGIARLCERCSKPVNQDWDYAWCKECGETGECHHGNRPHECNDCMIESDLEFDGARESVKIERRNDDPLNGE